VLEPGVEPLELERVDVDARAVQVLPRADDQLIAAGRALPWLHRGGDAPAGPGVLKLGVVGRFAALEDVELAPEQVAGMWLATIREITFWGLRACQ
jgi:hypothetical protein